MMVFDCGSVCCVKCLSKVVLREVFTLGFCLCCLPEAACKAASVSASGILLTNLMPVDFDIGHWNTQIHLSHLLNLTMHS